MMSDEDEIISDEELRKGLEDVVGGLLASIEADRRETPEYKELAEGFDDRGLAKLLDLACHRMERVVLDVMQILKDKNQVSASAEQRKALYERLYLLPAVSRETRRRIEKEEGSFGVADKTYRAVYEQYKEFLKND